MVNRLGTETLKRKCTPAKQKGVEREINKMTVPEFTYYCVPHGFGITNPIYEVIYPTSNLKYRKDHQH